MATNVRVGDRVAYTERFAQLAAGRAHMRGEVQHIENGWLGTVVWDSGDVSTNCVNDLCHPRTLTAARRLVLL